MIAFGLERRLASSARPGRSKAAGMPDDIAALIAKLDAESTELLDVKR